MTFGMQKDGKEVFQDKVISKFTPCYTLSRGIWSIYMADSDMTR